MKDFRFKENTSIENLINSKNIFPVFQPLLSLQNASVIGYESFIRFELDKENLENPYFFPENTFKREKEKGNVWTLDKASFKTAVKTARAIGLRKKLFINLNSASFFDKNFQKEYIIKYLQKYGIAPANVVFEISENDFTEEFQESIEETMAYFRSCGCQIALDNFGKQNFGFKKIYSLNPNYIKIDRTVIQDINTDEIKTSLSLEVGFAQGFFIGNPDRIFRNATTASYSAVSSCLYKKEQSVILWKKTFFPPMKMKALLKFPQEQCNEAKKQFTRRLLLSRTENTKDLCP